MGKNNISEMINQHFIALQDKVLEEITEKIDKNTFFVDKDELKGTMFDIMMAEFKEEVHHNQSPVSSSMALVTATLMRLYCELERKNSNATNRR